MSEKPKKQVAKKPVINAGMQKIPRRGEIWCVIDRNETHNDKSQNKSFESSVQCGTRFCIIVSNNVGNLYSPIVEIVYTTTKQKNDLPTHFLTASTPVLSTVLCEQIMTVDKKDLTRYYGTLTPDEKCQLDKCLKKSIGL